MHILRFRIRRLDRREINETGYKWQAVVDCPWCNRDEFFREFEPKVFLANSLPELRKRFREDRELVPLVLNG